MAFALSLQRITAMRIATAEQAKINGSILSGILLMEKRINDVNSAIDMMYFGILE